MRLREAKAELKRNINLNYTHAVLRVVGRSYYTELHGGHAGNCCCNEADGFVWREESPYTDEQEIRDIQAT